MKERPSPAPNIGSQPKAYTFKQQIETHLKPITMDDINACKSREEQIQTLGDRLHPLVIAQVQDTTYASKITGLIVGMKPNEVIAGLDDQNVLLDYIKQAKNILKKRQIEKNKNKNKNDNNVNGNVTAEQVRKKVQQMKEQQRQAVQNITNPNGRGTGHASDGSGARL